MKVRLASPEFREEDLRRWFWSWLDEEERARVNRLLSEPARRGYLAAHALLRHSLTEACCESRGTIAPSDWRFARLPGGKPILDLHWDVTQRSEAEGLHFSLSHTVGLVAVVLDAQPVGIDIEPVNRTDITPERIANFLSLAERDWLDRQPAGERRSALLRLWVLKEAYLKARGGGDVHLARFRIDPDDDPPTIHDDAPDSVAWHLGYSLWRNSHHLAIASHDSCLPRLDYVDLAVLGGAGGSA